MICPSATASGGTRAARIGSAWSVRATAKPPRAPQPSRQQHPEESSVQRSLVHGILRTPSGDGPHTSPDVTTPPSAADATTIKSTSIASRPELFVLEPSTRVVANVPAGIPLFCQSRPRVRGRRGFLLTGSSGSRSRAGSRPAAAAMLPPAPASAARSCCSLAAVPPVMVGQWVWERPGGRSCGSSSPASRAGTCWSSCPGRCKPDGPRRSASTAFRRVPRKYHFAVSVLEKMNALALRPGSLVGAASDAPSG